MYLYVLQLEGDNYYVGITADPETRMAAHLTGGGAKWTQLHKPIDILLLTEISGNCRKKESEMTLRMMEEYGVDNVRGGNWCSIKLSETPWQLRKDILIDMVESLPDYPG